MRSISFTWLNMTSSMTPNFCSIDRTSFYSSLETFVVSKAVSLSASIDGSPRFAFWCVHTPLSDENSYTVLLRTTSTMPTHFLWLANKRICPADPLTGRNKSPTELFASDRFDFYHADNFRHQPLLRTTPKAQAITSRASPRCKPTTQRRRSLLRLIFFLSWQRHSVDRLEIVVL